MIGVIATGLYIGNKSLKIKYKQYRKIWCSKRIRKKDSKKRENSLVEDNQDSDWG